MSENDILRIEFLKVNGFNVKLKVLYPLECRVHEVNPGRDPSPIKSSVLRTCMKRFHYLYFLFIFSVKKQKLKMIMFFMQKFET